MKKHGLTFGFILCSILLNCTFNSAEAFSRKLMGTEYDGAGGSSGNTVGPVKSANYNVKQSNNSGIAQPSIGGSKYVGPYSGECAANCSGDGAIKVDVTARCMCISGSKCFRIDTGREDYGGAMMSTNGTGIMANANSPGHGIYWTHQETSTKYDNDAISFGYNAQARMGKWLHKSANCGPGGSQNTIGCVGIPCQYWPEVKAQKGKRVVLCGGNNIMTSINGTAGAPRATQFRGSGQ